jgi:hypothetical protein
MTTTSIRRGNEPHCFHDATAMQQVANMSPEQYSL